MLNDDSDAFLPSIQVTDALNPTNLTIRNDSHLHSHHKAMVGSTSKETHF
jgi:BolA protein